MRDRLGRNIEYLRVSVTQNCNLRCLYCMPDKELMPAEDSHKSMYRCTTALLPTEFQAIIKVIVGLGVKKVRITGGEPLTRPDVCEIISLISQLDGIKDISMTTNGVYLGKYAQNLKNAGLKRINISLDSLDAEKFEKITGGGKLEKVKEGIEKALEVGLKPVKINTVLIKGINDNEVDAFFELTRDMPLEVRFIELMPVGEYGSKNNHKVVYNSDISVLYPQLVRDEDTDTNQPARYYRLPGHKGRIGFISPMSHKFCHCCNRIRLTCDGKIRTCLGDNSEADVIGILRNNPEGLPEFIEKLIFEKPQGHNFDNGFKSSRDMNAIGG